ncbi:hypothetical protein F0L68_39180 [Solihabitans fulvus]|uniref:Uncharacterized protein n=1 Tax=Solihabitans fulvus TaxID=1892852 RepID=A0A5B2WIJ6_9PSEU|nr:hypothetical protein [Solihabitans fulvus]KAA2250169.1 hypothetical protein F0L68_39180 [Solihabitans fulvus]
MENQEDTNRLLRLLDEEARTDCPRLFALYGVYREPLFEGDVDLEFLGWGMEFTRQGRAVLWMGPHETWSSDSAAALLRSQGRYADAKLVWLTTPPATP